MVDPSPWPALGTIAALTLATGGIWFMHGGPSVGADRRLRHSARHVLWWRDVIRKVAGRIYHTEAVNHGLRVGFLLFIASEVSSSSPSSQR